MALSITSANSVFMLSARLLFPVPQQMQGYAVDDAFAVDPVDSAEVIKGVDGKMSAGFIPFLAPMTLTLQADSPSAFFFEDLLEAQKVTQGVYFLDGTISLPAIGRKYTLTKGVAKSIVSIPGAKKVLQARPFGITWDDISPSAL